ncbi:hypothetical protein FS837_003368 [Tulasnella sp. UAMH 9824]|nr:hypothetical protein FS837_003368 [Tulasnella sp. UAMH 9824]
MALPTTSPISSPLSHSQTPFSDLSGKTDEAMKFVLSILNDTDWPKEAANDVQALINTLKTLPDLDKISKVETRIGAEITVSIELLLKESQKYGTKRKGFRKKFKKLFSRIDTSECAQVLQDCRNDLEKCSTALNNILRDSDHTNEESSSPVLTPPVWPNSPSFGSSPTLGVSRVTSVGPRTQKENKLRRESLNDAKKAFKLTEGVSGALPVVGTFVGAVAKVGLTVSEMLQAIDERDEVAERLGTHVCRLSNILEGFGNQPRQLESSQTRKWIEDLQGLVASLLIHLLQYY